MEEILASIRRILKEDDGAPEAARVDIDDDVLVLDDSMVVGTADVTTATTLPETAPEPMGPEPEAPLVDDSPLHAAAEPALISTGYLPEPVLAPAVEPWPAPEPWRAPAGSLAIPEPAPEPEPEPAPPAPVILAPEPPAPAAPEPAAPEPVAPVPVAYEPAAPEPPTQEPETPEPVLMEPNMPDQTSQNIEPVNRTGLTIEDIVREEIKPLLKSWLDAHLPSLVERVVRSEIERVIDRSGT